MSSKLGQAPSVIVYVFLYCFLLASLSLTSIKAWDNKGTYVYCVSSLFPRSNSMIIHRTLSYILTDCVVDYSNNVIDLLLLILHLSP